MAAPLLPLSLFATRLPRRHQKKALTNSKLKCIFIQINSCYKQSLESQPCEVDQLEDKLEAPTTDSEAVAGKLVADFWEKRFQKSRIVYQNQRT